MDNIESVLKNEERITFLLRSLYSRYGFTQYKMSKFEEYGLYADNRDFLVSDSIITFTDTNGKLMALKPDVTLSIVKGTRDVPGTVSKVFYDENVYRVSRRSHAYKEITQAGLECIGDLDDYNISEVLLLAAMSLNIISGDNVLNISHLGIISGLLEPFGLDKDSEKQAIRFIGEKNMHELKALLKSRRRVTENESTAKAGDKAGADSTGDTAAANAAEGGNMENRSDADIDALTDVLTLSSSPGTVIPRLEAACRGQKLRRSLDELISVCDMLEDAGCGRNAVIDFSVVNDMSYYNGIVFRGFVNGVPDGVLSGGQYDGMLAKMGRKSKAIGFAVYTDFLERFIEDGRDCDIDTVLLYDNDTDRRLVSRAVKELAAGGTSVTALRQLPAKLRFKRLLTVKPDGSIQTEGGSINIKERYNA